MTPIGKLRFSALVASCALIGTAVQPAQAGKVHWKDDPAMPTCAALAFDDTDEWFGTADGVAFKKGVCHGQRIRYSVVLAPNGESFTASGANICQYQVGDAHAISVKCRPNR